jgi:hypothetical protein
MEEPNPPGAGRSSSPPPPPSLRFRRPLWRSARPPCLGCGSSPRRSWPPSRQTQTSRSMPPSGGLSCDQGTRSAGLQQPTGWWECRRYVSGWGHITCFCRCHFKERPGKRDSRNCKKATAPCPAPVLTQAVRDVPSVFGCRTTVQELMRLNNLKGYCICAGDILALSPGEYGPTFLDWVPSSEALAFFGSLLSWTCSEAV